LKFTVRNASISASPNIWKSCQQVPVPEILLVGQISSATHGGSRNQMMGGEIEVAFCGVANLMKVKNAEEENATSFHK